MVQIGTIEYEARVTGAADARDQTDDLQESQEDLAETSERSAETMNGFAGTISGMGERAGMSARATSVLDNSVRLLSSTATFAIGTLGSLVGSITGISVASGTAGGAVTGLTGALSGLTLSGVVGSVTGALSGFVGWLAAGSAGAIAFAGAVGAGLGLLGVWALEVTGALDAVRGFGEWVGENLPGVVRDGLLQILSIAVGPLAVLGSMIVGFFEDGWEGAIEAGQETIEVFVGAWERQVGRIGDVFGDGVDAIQDGWSDIRDDAGDAIGDIQSDFRNGVDGIRSDFDAAVGDIQAGWSRIRSDGSRAIGGIQSDFRSGVAQIQSNFRSATSRIRSGWSRIRTAGSQAIGGIKSDFRSGFSRIQSGLTNLKSTASNALGGIGSAVGEQFRSGFNSLIPSSVQIPGLSFDIPDVAGGGTISIGGQSLNLPQLQTGGMVGETGIAQVHEGESVIPRPLVEAAESGGGDGGGDTVIESVSVTINGGDFDPSNMSRREVESLADRVSAAIGDKTNTTSGVR